MKNARHLASVFYWISWALFGLENPFLVHGETHKDVDYVGSDVCKVAGLHKLRNETGETAAETCVFEKVDAAFKHCQVYSVCADEYHKKSNDFRTFVVVAFEVPDSIAQVAIATSSDKTKEVGQFQIPVQQLVQHPDHK